MAGWGMAMVRASWRAGHTGIVAATVPAKASTRAGTLHGRDGGGTVAGRLAGCCVMGMLVAPGWFVDVVSRFGRIRYGLGARPHLPDPQLRARPGRRRRYRTSPDPI